jgi:hypothetical protein
MEKPGLAERLKAKLHARRQRSTERARMRQENRIEDDPRRAKSKSTGASGGV